MMMLLFLVGVYASVLSAIVMIVATEWMRTRVRDFHPDLWERFGRPRFLNPGKNLVTFALSDEVRTLGDAAIVRLAGVVRWTRAAFFAFGALSWLTAVIQRPRLGIPATLFVAAAVVVTHFAARRRSGAA
jgi:hypothetical protein